MTGKLKMKDIKKNASIEKKHSINKLKNQEAKYTFILVVFFMVLFCIIGYNALTFNYKYVDDGSWNNTSSVLFSSNSILLSKDNIMTDNLGMYSKEYILKIENKGYDLYNYQIVFLEDEVSKKNCGCQNNYKIIDKIKFMVDGEILDSFESTDNVDLSNETGRVIVKGSLKRNQVLELPVRVWLSEDTNILDEHFHGHFVLEELEEA